MTDITRMTTDQRRKLEDAVLAQLGRAGCESVSYVHRCLQQDGWKGLGTLHGDFEPLLRALGFSIREGKNERGQSRREVFFGVL